MHAGQALACDEVVPWAHGHVLRTPSAPNYWDANSVRVERGDFDAATLIATADELQAGLRHRKLEIEDEALGARLADDFAAAGWRTEALAMMVREGPPPSAHARVEQATPAETWELRTEWYGDSAPDDAAFAGLLVGQDEIGVRLGRRAFVVRERGRPIGFAMLTPGDGAVEVEETYVTPAHRSAGLGRALLESALAAGGQTRAWIVADHGGRPQGLYERLGFSTVWVWHAFIREPARSAQPAARSR
jgi:ribosomal protein S18 acetylase RimI-like enzyme